MNRGVVLASVGFAAFLLVALATQLPSKASTVELFDSEDPDVFSADSVYSASPARDDSARIAYATSDDSDDYDSTPERADDSDDTAEAALRQPLGGTVSPGAALSLLAGDHHVAAGEMLAILHHEREAKYRGSLAGRRRMLRHDAARERRMMREGSDDDKEGGEGLQQGKGDELQFPTPLQRKWEQGEELAEKNNAARAQESPEGREAASIRKRMEEAFEQQRQDRAIYHDNRILYTEPGRPANVAYHQGGNRRAAKLKAELKKQAAIKAAEKKLEKAAVRLEQEKRDKQSAIDATTAILDDDGNVPTHAKALRKLRQSVSHYRLEHSPSSSSSASSAATKNYKQGKQLYGVAMFDKDASHVAAMDAIDAALDSHSETDEKDSEIRHHVAEKLQEKADRLRELSEHQREKARKAVERAESATQTAKRDEAKAGELKKRAARLLSQPHHHHSSSTTNSPIAAVRNAMVKDEKLLHKDELDMANTAVITQGLEAKHKTVSLALDAKMAALRARVAKERKILDTDAAALENMGTDHGMKLARSEEAAANTPNGAAYRDTERAKSMTAKALKLRQRAQSMRTQARTDKKARNTILLAAQCLEYQSHALDKDESGHESTPQALYAQALKTCGVSIKN